MWGSLSKYIPTSLVNQKYVVGQPVASGGVEMSWTVYDCSRKDTKEELSLFVFSKAKLSATLKKEMNSASTITRIVEDLTTHLKADLKLTSTLRHPNILRVIEVLPESRTELSFIAERVSLSLANVRKDFGSIPSDKISQAMLQVSLSEFEITSGLVNVLSAVRFLHENKFVHGNISAENIWTTQEGWKLAGFGFAGTSTDGSYTFPTIAEFEALHSSEPVTPYPVKPRLSHVAPEVLVPPFRLMPASDIWSIGIMTCELFCDTRMYQSRIPKHSRVSLQEMHSEASGIAQLGGTLSVALRKVPKGLRGALRDAMNPLASSRSTAARFMEAPYFNEGPILVLRQVGDLLQKEPTEQATFLSSLPPRLEPFPLKVLAGMMLPTLVNLLRNPSITPYALPSVLKIASKMSEEEFQRLVAPEVESLIQAKNQPVQTKLQLLQHINLLIRFGSESFKKHLLLPYVASSLDASSTEVQLVALKGLPELVTQSKSSLGDSVVHGFVDASIIGKLTMAFFRSINLVQLVVRLAKVIGLTENEQIRLRGLIAATELIKMKLVLSQQIKTKILPALKHFLSKRPSAAVCMCTLGTLEACAISLGPESAPRDVIPIAVTLCSMEGLSLKQFDTVMTYLRRMLKQVEDYRHRLFAKGGNTQLNTPGKGVFDKVPLPQLDTESIASSQNISFETPGAGQQAPIPTVLAAEAARSSGQGPLANRRPPSGNTGVLSGISAVNGRPSTMHNTPERNPGDDPFLLFQQASSQGGSRSSSKCNEL